MPRYKIDLKIEDIFPPRTDGLCRFCEKKLQGKQTKWCSNKCSMAAFSEMMFQKGGTAQIRSRVFARDGGICAVCFLDCERIQRISDATLYSLADHISDAAKKVIDIDYPSEHLQMKFISERYQRKENFKRDYYKFARKLWKDAPLNFGSACWQADHIIEVINGGEHSLENLQTLCITCHKKKTKALVKVNNRQAGLFDVPIQAEQSQLF
jgi:5-methylcytosine-specific restriction endonuclease McrA